MALTLTPVRTANFTDANKRRRVYDVTLDSSYATGGYSLTPANVGLRVIDTIETHGFRKSDSTAQVTSSYDRTNKKLVVFSGGTEITNATDLSTYSGRMAFVGT